MAKGVTKRQGELLRFVAAYTKTKGYPPSMLDMRGFLGATSSAAAHDHLAALEKKGMVTRDRGIPRSTVLTTEGRAFVEGIDLRRQLG